MRSHAFFLPTFVVKLTPDADVFTDADRERFKDPEYYKFFRHELESDLNVSDLFIHMNAGTCLFSAVCSCHNSTGIGNASGCDRRFQGYYDQQTS